MIGIQKKLPRSWESPEESGRRRERLMEAAEKFSGELGTAPACRVFGVPRAFALPPPATGSHARGGADTCRIASGVERGGAPRGPRRVA